MRRILVLVAALIALATAGAAHAQTAPASSGLYTQSGRQIGTVTINSGAGGLQAVISLKGATANAVYAACFTDPLSQSTLGTCNPAGFGFNIALANANCFTVTLVAFCGTPTTAAATVATDASGSGTATIPLNGVTPTLIVELVNVANTGDNAQAVVATGMTGPVVPTVACVPGFTC